MTSGRFELLQIGLVQLDVENPRIRRYMEIYEEVGDDEIALALNTTSADEQSPTANITTPNRLRESIIANGGIRQPIIVNQREDGVYVCIEGNTRLWIYRDLYRKNVKGSWSKIPALVHQNLENENIDAIRLQAHLVGPRPWDAYSKAKYLHDLRDQQMLPMGRIVALCGGNQREVERSIQAYSDMEEFYRPICEGEFDVERFSGFVEYQQPKVQQALLKHGFTRRDFAEWIHNRLINALREVRQLPAVLSDKQARAVFLKKGVKEASKVLDREDLDVSLSKASLSQLTSALERKANGISMEELRMYKEEDGTTLRHIETALDSLRFLQEQIGD